jgi:hypothetical protein
MLATMAGPTRRPDNFGESKVFRALIRRGRALVVALAKLVGRPPPSPSVGCPVLTQRSPLVCYFASGYPDGGALNLTGRWFVVGGRRVTPLKEALTALADILAKRPAQEILFDWFRSGRLVGTTFLGLLTGKPALLRRMPLADSAEPASAKFCRTRPGNFRFIGLSKWRMRCRQKWMLQ